MEQLTASQQAEKQTMREYQRHGLRMPICFAPEEFIITVSFYQPSELATYDLKSAPEPKPGLEIEVLGSHTLNHLRQMFFCQRNYACAKDCNEYEQWITITEANDRYEEYLAMNICKGDMMFIHDTCYTDGSKEAADHFANVSKWIEEGTNKEIDPYMEKSMDTEIANMSLRFGYPYLYLHQGDCEHIIVFTSMRLPRPVEFSSFPRHEVVGKYTTKFCRIDKEYLARWIVCGSDRFPEDPILLCNSCVEQYCFTKGTEEKPGTKIGNFQLYPFLQIIAFI
jgi:snRNA-activating protein complex subunit 3